MAVRTAHTCHFAKSYKTGTAESRNTLRNRSEADKPFFKITAPSDTLRAGLRNLLIDDQVGPVSGAFVSVSADSMALPVA
jgi:hypothetical protein